MRVFTLLISLWLSAGLPAFAQTGALVGTVIDSVTREPVAGVYTVVKRDGVLCGYTQTDSTGSYYFSAQSAGLYAVEFISISTEKRTFQRVGIEPGKITQLNAVLYDILYDLPKNGKEIIYITMPGWRDNWGEPGTRTINRDPNSAIRIR